MRRVIQTLAALAVLGAVTGAAVVFGGLYDVSARNGHWPGVPWVLHTTFRNSVDLRAPHEDEVPELTEDMARLGARHFDAACTMCHAAPGQERTATVRAMVPVPPTIEAAVGDWSPAELHWIVAEGVKMSGMPHWPAARDDDVWPVVAFLTRVQGGMDAATYAEWTAPPESDLTPAQAYCAGCHGTDGVSGNPHIPRLDLQAEAYMAATLQAYRLGQRQSGIMAQAASEVPDDRLDALAAWFAAGGGDAGDAGAAGSSPAAGATEPDLLARGAELAARGDRDVPACTACHGPGATRRRADTPRLAGQYRDYLDQQLHAWRDGHRGGGPRAELMSRAAAELTDDEIAALAAWYADLTPETGIEPPE